MRNKKENFSNQNNNNQIYKKLEKGEQTNKNILARKKLESLNSPINDLFLYIFLVLAICLTTTLYLFYRFNSNNTDELYFVRDVHRLKAYIKPAQFIEEKDKNLNNLETNLETKLNQNLEISGFIEINEVFEGISIIGKLSGFAAGSTHGVHIIEFSDIIATIEDSEKSNPNTKLPTASNYIKKPIYTVKNLAEVKLNHYNPLKYKHSCPSTNEEENYHFGDLGNIIANSDGKAFISIMRKVSLKSLNGRLIVITNSPDKCKEGTETDTLADVIAFGQLNVFKPAVAEKTNGSQEFFLREINTVNKDEFDKKNKLIQQAGSNKGEFFKDKEKKKKDDFVNDKNKNTKNLENEQKLKNVKEEEKKGLKNIETKTVQGSNKIFGKDSFRDDELKIQSPPLFNMEKASDPAIGYVSQNKDEKKNFFSNTVFNENGKFGNNKINDTQSDKNKNTAFRIFPYENKYSEVPKLKVKSDKEYNSNDFYRIEGSPNSKNSINEKSTKENFGNKNSEDDSFIKEFQELIKGANSQPKQIKKHEEIIFNPFSDSNAKLNNPNTAAKNEFNPFDTLTPIKTKENDINEDKNTNAFNEKNPFDENKPAGKSFGSEILFPKIDIINPNMNKNTNKNDDKNIKELNDEEILNDLLGITEDFNKTIKKDPSSAKMKKAPSAAFIVPGTEGIDATNLDNYNPIKNFKSDTKDTKYNNNMKNQIKENTNFFNVLEKETNDLKNSNNENLNIFGAPIGKKNDIGINKLFEDVVKEEEKVQQKKIENLKKKEDGDNNNNLDLNLDGNLNQTPEKLDREIKKIPISLAQLDTEKEEKSKNMKKKKIDNNNGKHYSFMSSNLEPLMQNLVTNSTAKGFIKDVDLNLIDPFKISDMDDDNKNNKSFKEKPQKVYKSKKKEMKKTNKVLEEKKSIFTELSKEDEEDKLLEEISEDLKAFPDKLKPQSSSKTQNKTKTYITFNANKNKDLLKNPEDIYKIKIDNIQNFQDIIKNKTLNDLNHLPDKPIDLPLVNEKDKNTKEQKTNLDKTINNNSIDKKESKKADEKENPQKSNNHLKEKNSLFFDMNKKENFRFLNKLSEKNHFNWLKFRQDNIEKDSKDNNTQINDIIMLNKITNNTVPNSEGLTELQHALENKIKNYYSQNKNYLEKLNGNLTSLDKKILGIAKLEKDFKINNSDDNLKNGSDSVSVKKIVIDNKTINPTDLDKDKNLLTTFIQNVNTNMGTNLKDIANKFLKDKPKKQIDLKGLSDSVMSSIKDNISKSKAEKKIASDKHEKENKNDEKLKKYSTKLIEYEKGNEHNTIHKKMKRPEQEINYNIPSYFNSGLEDLGKDESEENDQEDNEEQDIETQYNLEDESDAFDNFFFIPKGSIIKTAQKGLLNISNEISKDTKNIEDEIAEDIQLDLFDEPNFIPPADKKMKKSKKLKKTNKSGFKSMDNFLEKFGSDKFYTDKIHNVDKNKMFFNHFKNTLPKFEDKKNN